MRRRTQAHDLRAELHRAVVAVVRDVVEGDVDRHQRCCVEGRAIVDRRVVHGATGTRKSRLMPAPSALTRSRNCVRYACSPVARISSMRPYCRSASRRPAQAQRVARLLVGDVLQVRHDLVHARGERARHVGAQDQQLGDLLGPDHVAVDLAVDLEARHRAQHRRPVIEVELDVLGAAPAWLWLWLLRAVCRSGSDSDSGCRCGSGSGSGLRGACRAPIAPGPLPKKSWSTEWNLTSSRRAVLSARSRKLPMRRKWNASSCSIVPTVTPRDRCERNFTHSNDSPGSRWNASLGDHALELEPGLVLRLPDLGGQRAAHRARVLARRHQAAADRRARWRRR